MEFDFKNKNTAICIAIFTLLVESSVSHAFEKLSEDDLLRLELASPAKGGRLSKDELYGRFPQVAYMEAFSAKKKELDQKAVDPDFKAKSIGFDSATKATSIAWTYHTVFAANPLNATGVGLGYATAGFLLFDLLTADRTNSNVRSKSIGELQHPSIYLVRELVGVGNIGIFDYPSDDVMRNNQKETIEVANKMGLGCEPAAWYLGDGNGVGASKKDIAYNRLMVCGFRSGDEVPWSSWSGSSEIISARTLSLSHVYLRGVSVISIPRINEKSRILKTLEINKEDEASSKKSAILVYERIKDQIDGWTAIYTGLDDEGKWSAFVSRNGETMIFPIPEK
jgi:hypothetical protein